MPILASKEFYETMELFESSAKSVSSLPLDFTKENKTLWRAGNYYCKGDVNLAFEMFMRGYEAAKCVFLTGEA